MAVSSGRRGGAGGLSVLACGRTHLLEHTAWHRAAAPCAGWSAVNRCSLQGGGCGRVPVCRDNRWRTVMTAKPPKLLSLVRSRLRLRQMSPRTGQAYLAWIRRFVRYHGVRHPDLMGAPEAVAFLTHLAEEQCVAQPTQMQALAALLFLYREVLRRDLGDLRSVVRARAPVRLPVVLTRDEVARVLDRLSGDVRMICLLLYGSGLRLGEALSLRVKDVDLERREVLVRRGKGAKDQVSMLPVASIEWIGKHLERVRALHEADRRLGAGRVALQTRSSARHQAGRRTSPGSECSPLAGGTAIR